MRETVKLTKAHVISDAKKEMVLLAIFADMRGGQSDVSDYDWHWINWFCNDEAPGGDDTFNRCINKGWLRSTYDSDTDHGTAYITPAGREALEAQQ